MSNPLTEITHALTLALALEWIKGARLDETLGRDLRSAVETACRWFKRTPENTPADVVALRQLFKSVSLGGARVTAKRFANVKSDIGRLLGLMGIGSLRTYKDQLLAEWKPLVETIGDPYAQIRLKRFGAFCSARGMAPCDVTDAIADEFLQSIELQLRVSNPRNSHRQTIRLWNRMAASLAAWPKQLLTLPSYSRTYVLPWAAFHPDWLDDLEMYLSSQATVDPFDLSAPIREFKPSSIATYKDRLRRFASCLVLTGSDVSQLRSLADLVQMEAVERGLRYLAYERKAKPLAAVVGTLLSQIARDHVCLPESEVKRIAEIAKRLRGKRRGLSPKVRERLAALKHEPNIARLFLLPTALMRSLMRKANPTLRDAQLFQLALALALLTVCPLRIGALCSIRIDRHFNWSKGPMSGDLILEFAFGELKGDEPASFPIPRDVANLIRVYWKRFRPLLDPGSSPFLFSGRDPARPKSKNRLSTQLSRLTFKELGFRVNPHLFRHVVHLVVLRRFPGAYAMVARVLTHRSIATTIQNYSHFDGELAMKAYQRLVGDIKDGGSPQPGPDPTAVAYSFGRESRYVGR